MVFAALVLWLRHAVLPNVDRYRADIVSSIERASGMAVQVRRMRGGWGGLRPVLELEGVAIADRQGKAAFQLERAEVSLAWWALLIGQVRFHDVDFHRPDLELRRGADGLIYLADKPLNEAGTGEGAFTEWLLAQPRVGIHDATLTWRDDFLGAPPVTLSGVEISVAKHRGRHSAALTARPSRELASRIDLRCDVRLRREGDRWRAAGEIYIEALQADLGRLRAHLPVPETLRSGVGSVRVWARFAPELLEEVTADVNVRDARAQLAADTLPLELAALSGRATYRARPDGFTFATEGLRFRLASGVESRGASNFSIARSAETGKVPRVEVRADGIDLKIASALVDYFPLPRDVKGQMLRFAPRGRIADAVVAWSDDGARTYSVKGRFEDLAVNAVEAIPGVSGMTGAIEGTEAGGRLRIAAKQALLDMRRVFRAPIALEALEVEARWKHAGAALEVTIDRARFANADAEGSLSGSWRSLPESKEKSPGYIDLAGSLTRASASRTANYLPNRVAPVRDWLEGAVQAGESRRVTFILKGDLYEFPFGGASQGRFLVEGDLRNGRLKYHPAWPSVDAIDGTFRFENRRMEIRGERAAIFTSRVKSAVAVVEDLGAQPPLLAIDGEVDTSGGDSMRFLRESPLVNGPGAFTRAVSVEGPARLRLHLDFPLHGTEHARVAGDYVFAGATATAARNLAMRDVKGRLAFTESGVHAPEITGTLFGRPALLRMSTRADGQVATTIEGRIDSTALGAYLPEAFAARFSGVADWRARVLSGAQGTELTVTSDLRGMASSLPEPLAKSAEDMRHFTIQIARLGAENELTTATLVGGVHGRFSRTAAGGADRWQAALKFGAPLADEPVREGLWLYGELPYLDVDAWQAMFSKAPVDARQTQEERAQGLELRGLDLKLARVHFLGRDFTQMGARLDRSGARWSGRLQGPLVAGEVSWNPEGRGRVLARLERLSIPEATAAAPKPTEPADLPALDVRAEKFDFRGRALGRLELAAEPVADEWRIQRLDIAAGHATFASSGVWRRTGAGSITTLALKLDVANLNALFNQFGYGEYVKRGSGRLEGNLVWPGQPHEFSLAMLAGTLKVDARGGQFAKIEPGAGKLLGLLSLQSLPRRAMFDFRDIFSDGFAFERIAGDVKIARGMLVTEDFEISGPAAFVSLAGEVSLAEETQTLTMHVVPEVGEGLALAASVVGTPVLGLSTLLVSKLLRNPLGKVVAYEYQVTGSWDNPVVTRTSAPPAKAAAQAPARTQQ